MVRVEEIFVIVDKLVILFVAAFAVFVVPTGTKVFVADKVDVDVVTIFTFGSVAVFMVIAFVDVVVCDIVTVDATVVVIFVVIVDIDVLEIFKFFAVSFVLSQSVKLLTLKKLIAGSLSRLKKEVKILTDFTVGSAT